MITAYQRSGVPFSRENARGEAAIRCKVLRRQDVMIVTTPT